MWRVLRLLLMTTMLALCLADGVMAAQGNLILQVPDWNQPATYGVAGYPNWCAPTAAADVMGYWEDVRGCVGLTDRLVFPLSPAYPATPGTWQQGLYHDGTIELGWFMDTGPWASKVPPPPVFPPNLNFGTLLANIGPGVVNYAAAAWVDNSFAWPPGVPAPGTGIVKVAYPTTTVTTDTGMLGLAAMWAAYKAEIDAGRPALVSFSRWVNDQVVPPTTTVDGFPNQTIQLYPWGQPSSEGGHTVAGVGYIDPTPAVFNGDELFVCQDNWGTTGQFVGVPVDAMWTQNDYVQNVPEPATLTLLVLAAVCLMLRRLRR